MSRVGEALRSSANKMLLAGCVALAWGQTNRRSEQVHTFSLPEALRLAAQQNPDILYARLETQHAQYDVDIARDPFVYRLTTHSDGVYTSGYPNNINGHSPSVVSAQLDRTLFDRVRQLQVAATREQVKSFAVGSEAKGENAMYQIASLFLEAKRFGRAAQALRTQIASLEQVTDETRSRVKEGASLAIELKEAQIDLVQTQSRLASFEADRLNAERLIASALGYPAGDRVTPAQPQPEIELPPGMSEAETQDQALAGNKELLHLKASLLAKRIELRSYQATRLPQVNLVAQYSLIQKNTYENYFPPGRVQRNNGEIGADFILPILVGPASGGHQAQAQTEYATLQIQISKAQNQIMVDTHRSFQQLKKAEEMLAVLRDKLDLGDSGLQVTRALLDEGRSSRGDVERAVIVRNESEIAVNEGEIAVERSRLEVLRQAGDLSAVLTRGTSTSAAPAAQLRDGRTDAISSGR